MVSSLAKEDLWDGTRLSIFAGRAGVLILAEIQIHNFTAAVCRLSPDDAPTRITQSPDGIM